jgi:GT2 family glycosyltransferase
MNLVTISIVLFNNNYSTIKKAIDSFLALEIDFKLYLIDNSPTNELQSLKIDTRIEYYHNPSNPGFGFAHNIAIKNAIKNDAKYHFVVNPDIYFEGDVISEMVQFMSSDKTIGMMMPKILNTDGTTQYLPKLLPTPFSILKRKLKFSKKVYNKFISRYELRDIPSDMIYNAPVLSGCFTLFSTEALQKIGFYDDSFFMYFEDWDISRRMHQKYKTIYFPKVSITHEYESGANKNKKLFIIFIKSAYNFFNKWGWIFDNERIKINKEALNQFK